MALTSLGDGVTRWVTGPVAAASPLRGPGTGASPLRGPGAGPGAGASPLRLPVCGLGAGSSAGRFVPCGGTGAGSSALRLSARAGCASEGNLRCLPWKLWTPSTQCTAG